MKAGVKSSPVKAAPLVDVIVTRATKETYNFTLFDGIPIGETGKPVVMVNVSGQMYLPKEMVGQAQEIRVTVQVVR